MTVENFKKSCEIELQGLVSGNPQQVKDAIENLTCIPDIDLAGSMRLQIDIRRRFNQTFLAIVEKPILNSKAWEAFNKLRIEKHHIQDAITAYRTGLALV